MTMRTMALQALTYAMTLPYFCVTTTTANAEETSVYMGAPVTLMKAPNGAIANKAKPRGIQRLISDPRRAQKTLSDVI